MVGKGQGVFMRDSTVADFNFCRAILRRYGGFHRELHGNHNNQGMAIGAALDPGARDAASRLGGEMPIATAVEQFVEAAASLLGFQFVHIEQFIGEVDATRLHLIGEFVERVEAHLPAGGRSFRPRFPRERH